MSALREVTVGLVAGVCGALVAVVLVQAPVADGEPVSGLAPTEALAERVLAMEEENRLLRARLDTLADRPAPVVREAADAPTREEFDALSALVRERMSVGGGDLAAAPEPVLEAAIQQVLDARDESVRQEKQRAAEQWREQRLRKEVDRWTEELGMTPYQAERMHTAMRNREVAMIDIKESVAGGSLEGGAARDQWGEVERGFDAVLEETLTPAQLESYRSARSGGEAKGGR